MSRAEMLEQFEARERARGERGDELTPGQIAEFEERAERLRRHPEQGMTWERVRAELKKRSGKSRAAGK